MKTNKYSNNSALIVESVADVRRVTTVTKGGRTFKFSVYMIAGDKNGQVNFEQSKAKEVSEARSKASKRVTKNMITVPLFEGRTIYHDVFSKKGSGKVILRKAPPGTGIIAGGAMRKIFECLGITDIVAKSIGSTNSHNLIAATFSALKKLSHPEDIARKKL